MALLGAIVVVDVTNDQALQEAQAWKMELDDRCTQPDGSGIPTVLVANKCDLLPKLANGQPDIGSSAVVGELMQLAQGIGYLDWELCSAKDDQNIGAPFTTIAREAEKMPAPTDRSKTLTYEQFKIKKQRGMVPEREPQACGC